MWFRLVRWEAHPNFAEHTASILKEGELKFLFVWFNLRPWIQRQYVLPKYHIGRHGVTTKKIILFSSQLWESQIKHIFILYSITLKSQHLRYEGVIFMCFSLKILCRYLASSLWSTYSTYPNPFSANVVVRTWENTNQNFAFTWFIPFDISQRALWCSGYSTV